MPIAHVCMSCGYDIGSTRPVIEPHYRLPIVTCPRCASVAVRRRHPQRAWRAFLRLDATLAVLALHAAMWLAFTAVNVQLVTLLLFADEFFDASDLDGVNLAAAITALALVLLLQGAWVTVGFSHLRFTSRWLAWFAGQALVLLIALVHVVPDLAFFGSEGGGLALTVALFQLGGMVLLAVINVLAMAGAPVGLAMLRLLSFTRRRLWRWRRRRRRLMLAST